MNFADELRSQGMETEESLRREADARYWADRLTEAIKSGCRQAGREGKRGIYGYVHMYREDGYELARFVEKLPSIKEFQSDIKLAGALARPDRIPESGTFEIRLYDGYIIPGNAAMLYRIEDLMSEELKALGFTDYRVQKVMLRDIYLICRQRPSLFSGDLIEKMSTRTETDPVYTMHFSISW